MPSRNKPNIVLLDKVVDLLFEIYLLRGDCSTAARALMSQRKVDEAAVEECARLDDTLAKSYRAVQHTVRLIQHSRNRRRTKRP